MTKQRATVLVVTLVAVTMLLILSAISLVMTTSQARLCEHQVRRIKAFYANEAGLVDALERLRRNETVGDISVEWQGLLGSKNVNLTESVGGGIDGTNEINATINYGY